MIKSTHTICCDLCMFEIEEVDRLPQIQFINGIPAIVNEPKKAIATMVKDRDDGMPIYEIKYFCRKEHEEEWLKKWKQDNK